jgi:predicted nucleic acid-binding Zn ribbon protein
VRILACLDCGAESVGPKRGKLPTRCEECRRVARRVVLPPATAECEHCGATYPFLKRRTGPQAERRFCSPACRNRHHYERARRDGRIDEWAKTSRIRRLESRPDRHCVICGDVMALGKRKLCGAAECHGQYHSERMSVFAHERRARMAGVSSERFGKAEIFERDGWLCGICGSAVSRDARFPDPSSPSLDHVVPLAAGGEHTRANTRCSHLGCNMRKGAQVAA